MERLRREQIRLAADRDAGRQQAAQAEMRLAALGDAVLEVIITVDRDLRVIDATPGAKELFDIGDDVSGRSLIEVTRSSELDQLAADALAAGPASPQAVRDELDRLIAVAGRPLRSRAAAFGGGVVLALSDVSELQRLGRARRDFIANISNIMGALKYGMNFLWVGIYFVKQNELVLGPFQGPVACTRIAFGKGVCGTTWKEKKTIIVNDVEKFPGHIVCSSDSKSEIVIPCFKQEEVFAVLDVDSDKLNDFDETDKQYLEKIALIIETL